ncbi:origin recognition complex subunit 1 [Acrasis kona]|uniref:Origin recognition complex subunit 1 n=1 Tax=Acrasis kona TaxID=1008807 RepID=A0AAW2ZHP0_9EUKA
MKNRLTDEKCLEYISQYRKSAENDEKRCYFEMIKERLNEKSSPEVDDEMVASFIKNEGFGDDSDDDEEMNTVENQTQRTSAKEVGHNVRTCHNVKTLKRKTTESEQPLIFNNDLNSLGTPLYQTNEDSFPLVFVNREDEAFYIVDNLISSCQTSHGNLVFIAQMNGTGKTAIVENLLNVMSRSEQWVVLQEKYKSMSIESQRLLNIKTSMRINLLMTRMEIKQSENVGERRRALVDFLLETLDEVGIRVELDCEANHTIYGVVECLTDQYPHLNFLFHWDELEAYTKMKPGPNNPQDQLSSFYEFWEFLVPTLRHPKVYHICTSKDPAFALIGLGFLSLRDGISVSPSQNRAVYLKSLSIDHIRQICNDSVVRRNQQIKTIIEFLYDRGLKQEDYKFFLENVKLRTGGFPRMIRYALMVCCENYDKDISLNSESNILEALDGVVYKKVRELCKLELNIKSICQPFVRLVMLMASIGISVDKDYKIIINSRELPIVRLFAITGVFTEPEGQDRLKVVIPKYMSMVYNNLYSHPSQLSHGLIGTNLAVDQGTAFEMVFVISLMCRIHESSIIGVNNTWGELVPLFNDSLIVGDLKVNLSRESDFIRQLPKVSKQGDPGMSHQMLQKIQSHGWSQTVQKFAFVQIFNLLLPPGYIGIPAKMSGSCDSFVKAAELVTIGNAVKFEKITTLSTVKEEIEKGRIIIQVNNQMQFVLVVFCLEFEENISRHLVNDRLTLTAGRWFFGKDEMENYDCSVSYRSLPEMTADDMDDKIEHQCKDVDKKHLMIEIPERMEVILVHRKAVSEVVGQENLDTIIQELKNKVTNKQLSDRIMRVMEFITPVYYSER